MNSLIVLSLLSLSAPLANAAKKDVVVAFVAHKNSKDLNTLIQLCRKNKLPENFEQNWNSMVNRGSPSDIKLLQFVHEHCSDGSLSEIGAELEGSLLYKHPEILFPEQAKKVHSKSDIEFNQLASDLNVQLSNYGMSKNIAKDELSRKLNQPKLNGDAKRLQELVVGQIQASYDRK